MPKVKVGKRSKLEVVFANGRIVDVSRWVTSLDWSRDGSVAIRWRASGLHAPEGFEEFRDALFAQQDVTLLVGDRAYRLVMYGFSESPAIEGVVELREVADADV